MVLLATSLWGQAQLSVLFDINDFKSHELEAAYTIGAGSNQVVWTTSALPMPTVEKHSDTCARVPGYMDGAICYRICGGGLAAEPIHWTFQWRVANKGHQTPFEACSGNGCRGINPEYYPGPQRGCGHFMIWKTADRERDLRIVIDVKPH